MLQKNLITALFMMSGILLCAQANYLPNELVVQFKTNSTFLDRLITRATFGVTSSNIEAVADGIETWRGLTFPRTVVIDGTALVFNNVEEIIGHININNNGGSQSSRVHINHGDLQYIFTADPTPGITGVQSDPLPNCLSESYRVVGTPDLSSTNGTRIILFDQLVTAGSYFENLSIGAQIVPDHLGTHGNSVASVIKHVVEAAGMDAGDYELVTYGVFSDNGTARYSDIIRAFRQLDLQGEQDAIISMSASAEFANIESGRLIFEDLIGPMLAERNLLLITSVGNSGLSMANVFPGSANIPHQISVAGSMDCFSAPWTHTNANNRDFSIVAEAEGVLTYDGVKHYLSEGTSFAAPLVAAVAAQVNSQMANFDATGIRDRILVSADLKAQFVSIVKDGRVLNATAATAALDEMGRLLQHTNRENTTIRNGVEAGSGVKIGPNPFSDHLWLRGYDVDEQELNLQLFSASGVLISEQQYTALHDAMWRLPVDLPAGSYFIRLLGSQGLQQQFHLIKG